MRNQLSTIVIAFCIALGTQQTASAQGTFGDVNANNRSFSGNTSYRTGSNYGGTYVAGGVNSATAGAGSAVGNLGGRELDLGESSPSSGRMLFADDQFTLGNRQAGQFVGTSLFDPRSFIGATTSGAQSGTTSVVGRGQQGIGGLQGRSMQGAGQQGPGGTPGLGGGRNAATPIRATARLAFEIPRGAPGRVNASLARRLQQPGYIQMRLPVAVTIDGRTARLQGEVATEYDRILAERFVRLEPGISRVDNELVVAVPSSDNSAPPVQEQPPAEPN